MNRDIIFVFVTLDRKQLVLVRSEETEVTDESSDRNMILHKDAQYHRSVMKMDGFNMKLTLEKQDKRGSTAEDQCSSFSDCLGLNNETISNVQKNPLHIQIKYYNNNISCDNRD